MNSHKAELRDSEIDALFREALHPYAEAQPSEQAWSEITARLSQPPVPRASKSLRSFFGLIPPATFWGGVSREDRVPAWACFPPSITMMVNRLIALRMVA